MDSDEAKQAELEIEIAKLKEEINTLYEHGDMVRGSDGTMLEKKWNN